ncbi:B-box zinc finger protein 21-like [Rhododendron vialii]|uniref:B-box zinc finger protein 21-like n=1 Tax=Rhododendron vialii TaxID=182163 RepID=UPI00265E18FB|nr:B-box zinc finger protein 21-like [Rhododendron vialii]
MKIQCDVCNKDEASVFCSADEAALCAACDHRVHHANKLAGKHQRFSLLLPSPKQLPLCDICQERKAFLFCQQDRAILCRECDVPIHEANEHTQNHNRFLLTGVKLSATSALYSPPPPSSASSTSSAASGNGIDVVPSFNPQNPVNNKPVSVQPGICSTPAIEKGLPGNHGSSSSTISEYLIEMLPGWRVEDFLVDSSPSSFGFCKTADEVLPNWEADPDNSNLGSISSPKNMGIWVPQAPPPLYPSLYPLPNTAYGNQISFKESKEATNNNINKYSRNWREEGVFTVPQIISPPSSTASNKRSRTFW